MKFFDIVWKEISLVKSQKIALLLIILYPLMVISLLGIAFSGGMDLSKMSGVNIGVVNDMKFHPDVNFSSINNVAILEYDDLNSMRLAIEKKQITAGLTVIDSSAKSRIDMNIYYDNSNLLASSFFIGLAKTMIQTIASEAISKELTKIVSTMSSLGQNLDTEKANVSDFKTKLAEAGVELDSLEAKVNSVNYDQSEVDALRASFNDFKSDYEKIKEPLIRNKESLKKLPAEIENADSTLNSVVLGLETIKNSIPSEVDKNILITQIAKLNLIKSQMAEWKATANQLIDITEKISDESSSINQNIAKVDAVFDKMDAGVQSISEVRTMIAEARASKIEIENKLNESEALLNLFSSKLIEMKDLDPKVLSNPVRVNEMRLYPVSFFGILVANSIVIVLILTCMLLTSLLVLLEKNQNVSLRLSLSNTSRFTLLIGKMTGQLVIALVEAAIIFVIASIKIELPFPILGTTSLGFGLVTNCSLFELFLGVVIISIAFISIGIIISFFTKSQSTAILASLLIVVPMLFLSGIILPLDFMSPIIKMVSTYLPLTLANNLLLGLIVKGIPLVEMTTEIGLLLGIALIVFIIVLVKKNSL